MSIRNWCLFAFSDWRVQPFEPLIEELENNRPHLVLYAGDDTERLGPMSQEALEHVLEQWCNNEESLRSIMGSREILIMQKNVTARAFGKAARQQLSRISKRSGVSFDQGICLCPEKPRVRADCLFYWTDMTCEPWLDEISTRAEFGLGAVIGNDCRLYDKGRFIRSGVFDLHNQPLTIDDIGVMGLQGAPVGGPGIVLYEEDEARSHLEKQWKLLEDMNLSRIVLVTHAPPKGVLDLSIRFGVNNIGSEAVREFIESKNIDLVICGHSHINGGKVEMLGETTILNIASHDDHHAMGKVAWIRFPSSGPPVIDIQLLHPAGANPVCRLPQVAEKRAAALKELGITQLDQVIEENRMLMMSIPGVNAGMVNRWIIAAKAFQFKTAYRLPDDQWDLLSPDGCIVYDIETGITQTRVFCVSYWDPESSAVKQVFEKDNEKKILLDFFSYLRKHPNRNIVSYSATQFDLRVLQECARKHGVEVPSNLLCEVDLGRLVTYCTLGLPKGGLKSSAHHFGYEWTHDDISGIAVGLMATAYWDRGDEPPWSKIRDYAKDDVLATLLVLREVLNLDIIDA